MHGCARVKAAFASQMQIKCIPGLSLRPRFINGDKKTRIYYKIKKSRNMNRAFRDVVRRSSNFAQLQSSPKKISASEIRKSFIDFFCEDNRHLFIPSSPVFSLKDPTLAFTNAGMNQFKDVFLGVAQPGFSRVANFQKCIRIGGIHNDLDQVGQDGYHHTFFEMLGNWSFGDYFKEEACRMSWDLLTKVYNLSPERLYVTYFRGDETLGLGPDVEVQEIWRKIGVAESHILPFGTSDNFWTGSVTGPCGPCTEIHYDHCPGRTNVGNLVNMKCAEVTELWNLVFIQYDRKANGELAKLQTNFVDTGMGFERLVAVLQGKTSNYDTDLFLPLFEIIKKHSGHSGYSGKYSSIDCGYRVLADHSRMITMALSDGMIPNHHSKVRGIIRKTLRTIEKIFNAKSDLLKELITEVTQVLSDAYPEIEKNLPKIHYIIDNEVEVTNINKNIASAQWTKMKKKFPALHDLDITEIPQILTGLNYIRKSILSKGKNNISSEDIFVLYDTYGIPVNSTQQIALKLGLSCDLRAYKGYEQFRKRTEKKQVHDKYLNIRSEYSYLDVIAELEKKKIQPTLDYFKYDYRVDGAEKYIFKNQPTTIEAILCDKKLLDEISSKDITDNQEIGLILDRTQLFSEDGGQVSDRGTLEIENEIIFDIERLVRVKDFVIHFGNFRNFPGDAKVTVQSLGVIKINEDRRLSVMKNHTALHLLNAALREEIYICGEKFSKVTPEKILLNFMVYRKSLSASEGIKKLEKYVRYVIKHGVSVKRRILNHTQFKALDDVVFIPGEDMLKREIPVIEINSGFKFSREYCTGTHVHNVSHIKDFIVMNFVKGSYNVSTIEAITGEKTLQIRNNDSEAEKMWSCLEKKISECGQCSPSKVDDLFLQVTKFSSEIFQSNEISYLTKHAISKAIEETKKNFNSLKKTSVRNFLAEELKKSISETSEKFLVLSWDRCWDFDPFDLEIAASCIEDIPLLMFFKYGDSAAVQCIVPQDYVSQKFSAQKWLIDSLISSGGGIAKFSNHRHSDLMYYMANRKMTEEDLRQAVNNAVYLAKKNIVK